MTPDNIEQAKARLQKASLDPLVLYEYVVAKILPTDIRTVLAELERLKEVEAVYGELLTEAFHEIASKDDAKPGWFCTNARTTAMWYGDELVKLGKYEKRDDGHGRVQWYRPVAS